MIVTMVELRRRMGEVMRAIERNETVTVTRRGKPKAVISPVNSRTGEAARGESELEAMMKHPAFGMWKDREDMADVEAYVRSIRKGRYDDL